MHEYVGNVHLHSTYSDGALTIPAIAEIGARKGLDFLIVTDHQTLAGLEQEQEGYYDKTPGFNRYGSQRTQSSLSGS